MIGRMGCNLLCTQVFGPFPVELIQQYRAALRDNGHDPDTKEVAVLCMAYAAETREQALQDFVDPVLWYYRTISKYVAGQQVIPSYEGYAGARDLATHITWEQLIQNGAVICGTPDDCIAQIETVRERYGATQFLMWTRLGGFENKKVMKSMELMQKYVFPHFRKSSSVLAA
jgi:alkanesulfonate monooxygenase SsuD/methylene tetrahydromethanopterin reductase-like flavin-dependent oxidoreductase (luciferase family)